MKDDGAKKINKWDSPSHDDQFGREPFVETIVKTIQSSKEGFNFGISARWGEGKSSILRQLQPKLEVLEYRVLNFEPWKYTQDKISIKRKFIIDIYSQLGKEYDEASLYGDIEREKDLDSEEYDRLFENRIAMFFKYAGVTAGIFLFLLFFIQKFLGIDINITEIFLSNLFVPILAGLLPMITKLTEVTIKQRIPRVESAEQFESLFNEAINELMDSKEAPKRIIIFVDDLDRCSHAEVEQILTALFTFFNNKHCTYVITADHTVIRRYISNFLQLEDEINPDGSVDVKKTNEIRQKEATEYLKKIFQINFILPRIPSNLLEGWTKDILDETPIIEFKNPYAKEYLINLILNNFHGNPRKIKHFIRTLSFQLEAIKRKIETLTKEDTDENRNLSKVKNSPELLGKILILQDRFPDFYEKITMEPKLLQKREEGEISEDKDLQNLLAQEPKFFNSVTRPANIKTVDPYYFLYFSGSTGFVETKIVDPAEIKALSRSADFAGLTKIINGLTDEPRNEQVENIKREFNEKTITAPEKVNVVRSLLHVISLIEEPTIRLQKLKDVFSAKTIYATEFASLQSVDFSKFISFATIEMVNHLFTEPPFTTVSLQNQILEAFIEKQSEIEKGEISEKFIQAVSEGIKMNDANSKTYSLLVSKIDFEKLGGAKILQKALIDTYTKADATFKAEIFEILLDLNKKLPSLKNYFEKFVFEIVSNESISEAVAMLGNIPAKINKSNIDIEKLIVKVTKRIEDSNSADFSQLLNILIHPAIIEEIGSIKFDSALITFVEILGGDDPDKKTHVKSKLPELISIAQNKSDILKRIVNYIATGPLVESESIISVVQGMSDFWNLNDDLKNEFATQLKKKARTTKEKEIKDLMNKSSSELVPPKVRKKEI